MTSKDENEYKVPEDIVMVDTTEPPEEVSESSAVKDSDMSWEDENQKIDYRIDETPPFLLCILLAFQHYITMFVAALTVPFMLAPAICMYEDNVGKAELTGTLYVACGFITLLQTTLGCRLPVVQAGTFALLSPTLEYLKLPQWKCPDNIVQPGSVNYSMFSPGDNQTFIEMGSTEHREIWMTRLREIQGSIMVAAVLEVFLGATGLVGVLLRFIGPLSISPLVTLLALSLFKSATGFAEGQWWICWLVIVLMIIFSQYLGWVRVPCCGYSKREKCHSSRGHPLLQMFPIILAIVIAWLICYILTVTDVLPPEPDKWGHLARTDLRTNALVASPWVRFPYPGQWGMPTVSISCVCALLSGIISTTVESVGDYHACAKLAGAPPPPLHAINRGIFVEGLGTFFDGLMGTGNGTTSASTNVGVVGLTKVGSRRVVQCSAFFMIVFGIFTKFGALFVTIPDPIIGGIFFILFGMIVAVGISNLQHVDMNSGRNLFIIGFSYFSGLAIPQWVAAHPGHIQTGNGTVDQVLQVLLSTSMVVGGFTGFFLDNTIPGTDEERGLAHWKKMRAAATDVSCSPRLQERLSASYDLPFGMDHIRRWTWTRYIPLSPTFGRKNRR